MASRYVPPALCNKSKPEEQNAAEDSTSSSNVTLEDIRDHFWPVDDDHLDGELRSSTVNQTLHDSAAKRGKLAYVLIFNNGKAVWDLHGIILVKSDLNLLPQTAPQSSASGNEGAIEEHNKPSNSETEEPATIKDTEVDTEPSKGSQPDGAIAVFIQHERNQSGRAFAFEGWFKIDKLKYFEPQSPELITMMERKWSVFDTQGNVIQQQQREPLKWAESLRYRWAQVGLVKDEDAQKRLGLLTIKHRSKHEREGGVNAMLSRLRMAEKGSKS